MDLSLIPESPGVYLMKDSEGGILYVGKAKNLKARLSTYFAKGGDDRAQIPYLLFKVQDVETILVPTETEALLLESRLIQQHQPPYNVLLKDDKSHVRIRLNRKHPFPRLEMVRSKRGEPIPSDSFGPFVSTYYASELFTLLIRLFRLRQCTDEELKRRTKPCLLYQLKKCSAPCVGFVSQEEYGKAVTQAIALLKGKNTEILTQLEEEMQQASSRLDFERALLLQQEKKALESALQQIQRHSISTEKRLDVVALHQEERRAILCVMEYRNGVLMNSSTSFLEVPVVLEGVEQLLLQYYRGAQSLPSQLFVSKGVTSKKALEDALYQEHKKRIEVHCPERGRKRELVELAARNAQQALLQKTSSEQEMKQLLSDTEEQLGLFKAPCRIDCFDVSHLAGRERVASCISFVDGKPNKKLYRTFTIKTVQKADDCSMLQEAIERRYRGITAEEEMPDLILVDGGRLQLMAAVRALEKLEWLAIAVRSLSKEEGKHDRGMTLDRVWEPESKEPTTFERTSRVLHFVQRIRDEAHRFAITFQKKRRHASFLASPLDGISGIGPKKKKALLTAFQGIQAIKRASVEELCQKARISKGEAERLKLLL